MRSSSLTWAVLSGSLTACGGGGSTPTSPPPLSNPPGYASFSVADGGSNLSRGYSNDGGNLVFCRPNGQRWWIRFAADAAANGESGPHMDLDLCHYAGSGSYGPMDPRGSCPEGMAWNVRWHDGADSFASQAASSPCQLGLTLNGRTLDGMFSCRDLLVTDGSRTVDIDGMFRCTIER